MTGDLLIPVRESVTLRQTVAHAVDRATAADARPTLHFVYPITPRLSVTARADEADALLERVEVWVDEDLGEEREAAVRTAVVGGDQYLFNPSDYATALARYAREHGVGTVLLDPEFNPRGMTPLLPPLETELEAAGLAVAVGPVDRPTQRFPLVRRRGLTATLVTFGWAFGFYLLIAGSLDPFELATGAISAFVVTALLGGVALTGGTNLRRLLGRVGRMALYVPYLLWEIAKANVGIAYVVLHPSLPIDPEVVEFDAAVWSELPATTLANSITLTPGTLTVDVTERHFTVHSLTAGARQGLFAGDLERAVRFVFYGRSAADIPSPAERGDVGDRASDGDSAGDAQSDDDAEGAR